MKLQISDQESDAILAALRLLGHAMTIGDVEANDGDIGDILTCGGKHAGLTREQVDALGDNLQSGALEVR